MIGIVNKLSKVDRQISTDARFEFSFAFSVNNATLIAAGEAERIRMILLRKSKSFPTKKPKSTQISGNRIRRIRIGGRFFFSS